MKICIVANQIVIAVHCGTENRGVGRGRDFQSEFKRVFQHTADFFEYSHSELSNSICM